MGIEDRDYMRGRPGEDEGSGGGGAQGSGVAAWLSRFLKGSWWFVLLMALILLATLVYFLAGG